MRNLVVMLFSMLFITSCDLILTPDPDSHMISGQWTFSHLRLSETENHEIETGSKEYSQKEAVALVFGEAGTWELSQAIEYGGYGFLESESGTWSVDGDFLYMPPDTFQLLNLTDSLIEVQMSQSNSDLVLDLLYPDAKGEQIVMVFKRNDSSENQLYIEGTFTDLRDGYTYKTAKIGNQEWIVENLRYDTRGGNYKYSGTFYPDSIANFKEAGYLYTYKAAHEACPDGWRIPIEEDWNELVKYAGAGEPTWGPTGDWYYWEGFGHIFKAETGWLDQYGTKDDSGNWVEINGNGTNEYGFCAYPGGQGINYHNQTNFKSLAAYWTESYFVNNGSSIFYPVMRFSIDNTDQNWIIIKFYGVMKFEGEYGSRNEYFL